MIVNYEIQISSRSSPMVILSETVVDNEKMPRGEGQGGEEDETDTDWLSSSRNI